MTSSVTSAVAPLGTAPTSCAIRWGSLPQRDFLIKVDDRLTARRPLYFLADPIVRFTEVVIEPYRPLLEEGAESPPGGSR